MRREETSLTNVVLLNCQRRLRRSFSWKLCAATLLFGLALVVLNTSIMDQIQSTWLPVIDRNPQKFVPGIYDAQERDFVAATQSIYWSPAPLSHLILPVTP